jgi:hypothetical protein
MVSACGPQAVRERRRNRTKRRFSPACAGRWSVAQADRDPAQGLVRHGESYWTWVHESRNIKGLQAGTTARLARRRPWARRALSSSGRRDGRRFGASRRITERTAEIPTST